MRIGCCLRLRVCLGLCSQVLRLGLGLCMGMRMHMGLRLQVLSLCLSLQALSMSGKALSLDRGLHVRWLGHRLEALGMQVFSMRLRIPEVTITALNCLISELSLHPCQASLPVSVRLWAQASLACNPTVTHLCGLCFPWCCMSQCCDNLRLQGGTNPTPAQFGDELQTYPDMLAAFCCIVMLHWLMLHQLVTRTDIFPSTSICKSVMWVQQVDTAVYSRSVTVIAATRQ